MRADGRVQAGAEAFLNDLRTSGVSLAAAEQDLFILGHYSGAVTVLANLEDLMLSSSTGMEKVAEVQKMIEECGAFVADRRALLEKLKEGLAREADVLARVPRQDQDGQ